MVFPLGGASSEDDSVGPGGDKETNCGGYLKSTLINR